MVLELLQLLALVVPVVVALATEILLVVQELQVKEIVVELQLQRLGMAVAVAVAHLPLVVPEVVVVLTQILVAQVALVLLLIPLGVRQLRQAKM